jgi:hypothetical protein
MTVTGILHVYIATWSPGRSGYISCVGVGGDQGSFRGAHNDKLGELCQPRKGGTWAQSSTHERACNATKESSAGRVTHLRSKSLVP